MISILEFDHALKSIPNLIAQESNSPRIFTLSVKKRFDKYTLLDLYSESFPHVNRDFWKHKIESGNLLLNKKETTPNQIVRAGQITQHTVAAKEEPNVNWNIELIHASTNYWVVNKPSPLPVHSGGRYLHNTLTNGLKLAFPDLTFHLINRLDANTTGIVLIALNKKYANLLSKQFENRKVTKNYLALVEGFSDHSIFECSSSISKEKTPAGGRTLVEGNNSQTNFKVLKELKNYSLLQVQPHSGHTNQIRLHLASLKLPIVGDLGYKKPDYFKNNPLTYPTDTLFLHAWKLKFEDPETLKTVEFMASPNSKWQKYL